MSTQYALPALFAFGGSVGAPAPVREEPVIAQAGEASAIRVLYQAPPRRPSRPSRGRPVRDWFASLLDALLPRPAVLVPAYARVRR